MIALLKNEAKFVASAMGATSPVALGLALPEVATLLTLIAKSPFEGKVLKAWAKDIHTKDLARIMDQIKIGLVQGEAPRTET